jgi:hypothetical protein
MLLILRCGAATKDPDIDGLRTDRDSSILKSVRDPPYHLRPDTGRQREVIDAKAKLIGHQRIDKPACIGHRCNCTRHAGSRAGGLL